MMKFFFWLIVSPLAVLVAIFGVANSQPITLSLEPFAFELTIPLYATLLVGIFIGQVVGGISTWLGQGRWRRKARGFNRRIRNLERDLENARPKGSHLNYNNQSNNKKSWF